MHECRRMQILPSLWTRRRQAPQEAKAGDGEGCRALAECYWHRCGDWCGTVVRAVSLRTALEQDPVSLDSTAAWTCTGLDALCKAMWQCTDKLTWIIARAAAALRQQGRPWSVTSGHLRCWQVALNGPHASELLFISCGDGDALFTSSADPARLWLDHRPTGETQSPNGRPCILGDLCTHQLEVPAAGCWSRACLLDCSHHCTTAHVGTIDKGWC